MTTKIIAEEELDFFPAFNLSNYQFLAESRTNMLRKLPLNPLEQKVARVERYNALCVIDSVLN